MQKIIEFEDSRQSQRAALSVVNDDAKEYRYSKIGSNDGYESETVDERRRMKRRMKDRMGNVGGPGLLVSGEHCIQIVPSHPALKRYQQIQSNTAEDGIVVEWIPRGFKIDLEKAAPEHRKVSVGFCNH